jgi:hypothetical protein
MGLLETATPFFMGREKGARNQEPRAKDQEQRLLGMIEYRIRIKKSNQ